MIEGCKPRNQCKHFRYAYVTAILNEEIEILPQTQRRIVFNEIVTPIQGNVGLYNVIDGEIKIGEYAEGVYSFSTNVTAMGQEPDFQIDIILGGEIIQSGIRTTNGNIYIGITYPAYFGNTGEIIIKNLSSNSLTVIPTTNLSIFRVSKI